eukprot:SAG22_NODE_335_length_12071_cov_5.268771_13_plen_130_part_00
MPKVSSGDLEAGGRRDGGAGAEATRGPADFGYRAYATPLHAALRLGTTQVRRAADNAKSATSELQLQPRSNVAERLAIRVVPGLLIVLRVSDSYKHFSNYGLSRRTARGPVEATSWDWGTGGWPICFLV